MRFPFRRLAFVSIATALAVLGAGCAGTSDSGSGNDDPGSPVRGGTLTVIRATDIDGWDPDKTAQLASFQTLPLVMQGLVRPAVDGLGVRPGLAEKWDFDTAGKTLTFHLREDLKFSNGDPVTAADVVFSVGLWKANVMYGTLYSSIKRATAPDARTVTLHLTEANTFLLDWLANATAVVVPDDFAGKARAAFFAKPIGAGPYVVEEYVPGRTLRLTRNDLYYDSERPYLDEVVYDVVSDSNQQLLAFRSGRADVIESVPLNVSGQLDEQAQYVVEPTTTVHSAYFNLNQGPGTDVHFRRAVGFALDKDAYTAQVFGGLASVADGALPPGVVGSAPCECGQEFDVEQAKSELHKSTYSGEEVVIIVDNASPTSSRGGQVVQQMLTDVGINVTLQPLDAQVMYDRFAKGEFTLQIAEITGVSPSVGDMFGVLPFMLNTTDEETTRVVSEGFAELSTADTPEAQRAATSKTQQWLAEQQVLVPIANPSTVMARARHVGGLTATPYLIYPVDEMWVRE